MFIHGHRESRAVGVRGHPGGKRKEHWRDWSGDALMGLSRKISVSVKMSNHTEPVRKYIHIKKKLLNKILFTSELPTAF